MLYYQLKYTLAEANDYRYLYEYRISINDTELDIILADEPTGALDRKTGQEIMKLLLELNKQKHTIVIVTHDRFIAEQTERIINLKDGKIKENGTVSGDAIAEGLKEGTTK